MATVGSPVSVTFPTVLTKGQPITISAVDQDNNPTTPVGVTFSSASPDVTVTPDPTIPFLYFLKGVPGTPVSSIDVTFTDAAGDTVVVTATTQEPPASTTLIATPGTPV
jgi:hypothetical protein